MAISLSTLILEDNQADVLLIVRELRRAGFDPHWQSVDSEADYLARLEPSLDIILADYTMPQFDAPRALTLLRQRGLDIPFIIVSGSIGEDTAVSVMKLGAADYLLKDRLARLGLAVTQALEQKRLRDQKRQAEEALQQRLQELAEADQHKNEFLAMLAHELRNPLAPIRNALYILQLPSADASAAQRAREMLQRQVQHLTRLVDDLLDVSRISKGLIQLKRAPVDLGLLVRSATADQVGALDRAGITLALELPAQPAWVLGDATRLTQVLDNLLHNAIKFTPPGGRITLRLTVDGRRGQTVLSVHDTGIGIEPAFLPRIFEVFSQADRSLDRSRGGLGVGLALVKGLVELHGGEVHAASAGSGHGTRFTVQLPLQPEPAALPSSPAPSGRAGRPLRILVVEDNRDAADSLRLLLELLGHEVAVAYTGPAGVEAARQWRPEVVFCDIGLPGMDGYAVAGELRRNPAMASARLLAVTGYGHPSDYQRSRQAGFDHHLVKPFDPEVLQALLQEPAGRGGSWEEKDSTAARGN